MAKVGLKEVARYLELSEEEAERRAVRALLEQELRKIRAEIISICRKYGVDDWEGLNRLIVEGKVRESDVLEDFQRVDHLTAKAKRLEEALRACD